MTRSVLVIAQESRLRDGLGAVLQAMPQISEVREADDVTSGYVALTGEAPSLTILDGTYIGDEMWSSLHKLLQNTSCSTQWIVLVTSRQQEELALRAGADGVLFHGFSAHMLQDMLIQLEARRNGHGN